ncbi:AcfA family outer membrane beta-barrel protein [Vibrio sp. L5-1]|jgi:accessory colonization factor AcfA|uniref:AcfA family outer membrane beta-barrel protein n=1 Tax=Vibrio sp. L5-1 TaxID=2912254 RepID=UPI001F212EB5|nr:AcfA family outer membrane beta-barrel protein [Vibrio sp. L5-1]MCF7497077.1 AcfA family outer membrane beta-barrel protein [Vibrio sp. L5-1]
MQKLLLIAIFLAPLTSLASPYIGLEYGFGFHKSQFNANFSDGVTLKPEFDYGIVSATSGFSFNEKWAAELSYSQYKISESRKDISVDTPGLYFDKEWDASMNVKQVELSSVYTLALDGQWSARLKTGVTYNQYRAKSRKTDNQNVNGEELSEVLLSHKLEENHFGGVIGGAIVYDFSPMLSLGASINHQMDKFNAMTSLNLMTRYYF